MNVAAPYGNQTDNAYLLNGLKDFTDTSGDSHPDHMPTDAHGAEIQRGLHHWPTGSGEVDDIKARIELRHTTWKMNEGSGIRTRRRQRHLHGIAPAAPPFRYASAATGALRSPVPGPSASA
ncbi:hypothetical protein [Streptomyces sp. NPDC060275]|uniref:hypothetical protein n=1 Tax=Streptomyces sp. NPDC060275 TaxID=3347090 RepID=UPI00364AC8B9